MSSIDSRQLSSWVLELMPAWSPDELGGFQFLEGGYNNRNFRFRYADGMFVLRVPGAAGDFTDRALEAEFYRQSSRFGGPRVPVVLSYSVESGRMLSAWVSGHLLADLTLEPNELASLLRDLHDALAHVRQHLSPIALRRYNPVEYAQRALAPTQVPDWLKAGADSMLWNPAHEALCHNDLNPWNLIRTPEGEWVTLDWEWLALNDPLFDLAALYQGAGLQPTPSQDARGLEAFARTYSADPISSQRVQACWSAYWLRETAWAAAALHGGANRLEIVSQYELGLEWLRCLWA